MSNLPLGWHWATLGAVSEKPQYGWTTKANHETGKLKLLRTTDITSGKINWSTVPYCTDEPDDIEKYLLKSGDILISRAGSIGVSFLINKPDRAVFASYLIRFRIKNSCDKKYVYYYLKSPEYWAAIGASKVGIAVPNVNATKLAQVPIPIAPDSVQKLIVAEIEKQFSRLDEAVAGLKRIKANLKRYKASVLKAAVEGKLTEEWRLSARRRAQVDELENIPKAKEGKWFVYIIECDNQSFYVGHSSDLHARWQAHCNGKAADWTHQHTPKYLIHFEVFDSKEDAVKREKNLKTGFGQTWRKREIAAGRMKPIVHNPENETALPVHEVQTGEKLLKRILSERKKKWEEKNPGKKYKEAVAPDTSNLPELPKGWVWAKSDQLFCFVTSGSRGWANYYSESGPIFIRMGNLDHNTIALDLSDIQRVKPPEGTEGSRTRVMKGDILISITADVGMVGVVPDGFEEAYINQHVALARPDSALNDIYLAWFLTCKNGQDQLRGLQRGATKVGLGLDDIKAVDVPLPPMKEQTAIIEEIDRIFSVADEIEAAVETNLKRAEHLRQSILKKAFGGKLTRTDILCDHTGDT